LIITSDLEHNLHFRFLMQQSDVKAVRRLHSILTGKLPDIEGLWLEWSIIQEIVRILEGYLSVRILNKKFLCVDVTLQAHREGKAADTETGVSIRIRTHEQPAGTTHENENEIAVANERK